MDNAVDESLAGYCDHSDVRILADGGLSVADNGRGIPVDIHPVEGRSTVEVVLTVLHAGGKFGGGGYAVSGGLHGVGISVVNALSTRVDTTVRRQGHIGRLASYPLMAAEAGMIGMIWADSGRSPKGVAPFGGREARLGTNPWSVAVPSDLAGPLFIDMATSAVAQGKVSLARARGEAIPAHWVLDGEGSPTTDPNDLFRGGALLPLGGSTEGYKGYGLAVIGEILCGILTGLGFGVEPSGRHNDGCFMAAFSVDAFRPLAAFRAEVTEFAEYLKATPPGFQPDSEPFTVGKRLWPT